MVYTFRIREWVMEKSSPLGTFMSLVKREGITFVTFEENHKLDKFSNWVVDRIILTTEYLQPLIGRLSEDVVRFLSLTLYWSFRLLRSTLIITSRVLRWTLVELWRVSKWTMINSWRVSRWTLVILFGITWTITTTTLRLVFGFLGYIIDSESPFTNDSEGSRKSRDPTILRRSEWGFRKTFDGKNEYGYDIIDGTGKKVGWSKDPE